MTDTDSPPQITSADDACPPMKKWISGLGFRPASSAETILVIVVAVGCLLFASSAEAHQPATKATRELIRIQGHRSQGAPTGMKRSLMLSTFGREQAFAATDWQVFGFSDAPAAPAPDPGAKPQRFILQGSREILNRFANARPEQTITILAEHRPGAMDLFVLTVDLCPP